MQQACTERERYLRLQLYAIQRLAHIATFEWEIGSGIWNCSDEYFRIFGLEPQSVEINDALLSQQLSVEDKTSLMNAFEQAASDRQSFVVEHGVLRPDGTTRIVQVQGHAVMDTSGVAVKLAGTSQDITELRRSEEALHRSMEQLLQSQKMEAIGQLVGGVAHDFNNMLTVISGYGDIVLNKLSQADPLRYYLLEIRRASQRASTLTRQLLAFSRRRSPQPQAIDLKTIIRDLVNMISRLIGEDIELETVFASTLGDVKADPGQIEQVILNLAINARDAMPNGGHLTIETQNVRLDENYVGTHIGAAPGDYVMIAVSDTGCGIDEKNKHRIFEPFFTSKEIGRGTGLGLSTVHRIIQESGGYIWVYSELGKGTTFKIYLPMVSRKTENEHRGKEAPPELRGTETILLVEDEELLRKLTRDVLELHGYHVLEASNGQGAMSVSERHPGAIHLLLTDVVMPEIGGRALAVDMLKLRSGMRVLFMSGYTADAIRHKGIHEFGMHLIQKPFSADALAHRVREVLDSSAG